MTARLEDAKHLFEGTTLVRDEVQHAVADDDIGSVGYDGNVLDIAESELNVVEAKLVGILACFIDHLRRHIDADHLARFTSNCTCDEGIVART